MESAPEIGPGMSIPVAVIHLVGGACVWGPQKRGVFGTSSQFGSSIGKKPLYRRNRTTATNCPAGQ